jgi:ABC-type transport system substrate-binding protein
MSEGYEHGWIPKLKRLFAESRLDRREFLRTTTLLGLSAGAAYAFAGRITGDGVVPSARAAMPQGGHLRIGMRVHDIKDAHVISWTEGSNLARQIFDFLTRTDQDNVTRPCLLEKWEPSEDLKTWTLHLRKDVTWRNGRKFVADDVVWNLTQVLDAKVGSSVLGLMKGYMLDEYDTDELDKDGKKKKATRLWDANAIEKVDDFTVRLNIKVPQLAVPEHLFHYPFSITDPEASGKFGIGVNGTGPFELVEYSTTQRALLRARKDYWAGPPHVDMLELIDTGDEPATAIAALASKQVDGLYEVDFSQLEAVKGLAHVTLYTATTAQTGVARFKYNMKPFNDARVRMAMKLAVDHDAVVQTVFHGAGSPRRGPSCEPGPSRIRQAAPDRPRRRQREEIARRGRLFRRARPRDRLQGPASVGAQYDASAGRAVEGRGHPGENQSHAGGRVLGCVDEGTLQLHLVGASTARRHDARPRLPYRRAVERIELLESRVRPAALRSGRYHRRRQAARGGGEARANPARRWPDGAAAVAQRADRL